MPRTDHHARAGCWEDTTLRSNVVSDVESDMGIESFASSISFLQFKKKRNTYRYKWNERENTRFHECKRQNRLQKQKKTNNSAVKRKNVGAKSSRTDETNQEAQKRLKAQRQWGASRRQCQRAEQTARRLLDQSEGNAHRHENDKTTIITTQPETKVLTQAATSSSETFYDLFVNSRFHFPLGIEPCQMRFKTFRSQFREVLKFGPRAISIGRLCYVLTWLGDFPSWTITY